MFEQEVSFVMIVQTLGFICLIMLFLVWIIQLKSKSKCDIESKNK